MVSGRALTVRSPNFTAEAQNTTTTIKYHNWAIVYLHSHQQQSMAMARRSVSNTRECIARASVLCGAQAPFCKKGWKIGG
ncbi:hypothetical protein CDAR_239961 [Caerostris darwini]|uniref:Uncharacterized protein n=1 Tax=Caerostris darwini TaxID=1538125 RepID=A0AAV4T0C8_9ARAC|nr:hypothetical protein CDAR_239961 [Caerostris darwini]